MKKCKKLLLLGCLGIGSAVFTGCGNNHAKSGMRQFSELEASVKIQADDASKEVSNTNNALSIGFNAAVTGKETEYLASVKSDLNVYSQAGKSSSMVGRVLKGQTVSIIGDATSSGWYKIVINGRVGYVEVAGVDEDTLKAANTNDDKTETTVATNNTTTNNNKNTSSVTVNSTSVSENKSETTSSSTTNKELSDSKDDKDNQTTPPDDDNKTEDKTDDKTDTKPSDDNNDSGNKGDSDDNPVKPDDDDLGDDKPGDDKPGDDGPGGSEDNKPGGEDDKPADKPEDKPSDGDTDSKENDTEVEK